MTGPTTVSPRRFDEIYEQALAAGILVA